MYNFHQGWLNQWKAIRIIFKTKIYSKTTFQLNYKRIPISLIDRKSNKLWMSTKLYQKLTNLFPFTYTAWTIKRQFYYFWQWHNKLSHEIRMDIKLLTCHMMAIIMLQLHGVIRKYNNKGLNVSFFARSHTRKLLLDNRKWIETCIHISWSF